MKSKHDHCPEHLTYPPKKPLPKEDSKRDDGTPFSSTQKKQIKKTHTRRSRQSLKDINNDEPD